MLDILVVFSFRTARQGWTSLIHSTYLTAQFVNHGRKRQVHCYSVFCITFPAFVIVKGTIFQKYHIYSCFTAQTTPRPALQLATRGFLRAAPRHLDRPLLSHRRGHDLASCDSATMPRSPLNDPAVLALQNAEHLPGTRSTEFAMRSWRKNDASARGV